MKYLVYAVLTFIVVTLLVGTTTFFFKKTQGEILSVSTFETRGTPYPAKKGGAKVFDGGKKKGVNVQYQYVAKEQVLSNSIVAFWLIQSPDETFWEGQKINVFYAPYYPKVAVLKRGPDIWLLLLVILILIIWISLKSMLRDYL